MGGAHCVDEHMECPYHQTRSQQVTQHPASSISRAQTAGPTAPSQTYTYITALIPHNNNGTVVTITIIYSKKVPI